MADHSPVERASEPPIDVPTADRHGPPTDSWLDRDLARHLAVLTEKPHLSAGDLDEALRPLVVRYGDAVFAELLFLLANLELDAALARQHWLGIREHAHRWVHEQHAAPDIRVVLLHYFLSVDRMLARPKIVEMDWAQRTAASAFVDETTGLPNQRFLRAQLDREVERALLESAPLSLLFLDVDDFKHVNDTHGHQAGNTVLRALARTMRHVVLERASLARFGGEEFVVMLPASSKREAAEIGERLRAVIADELVSLHPDSTQVRVTVSVGVATCPADARTAEDLLRAADAALYRAKRDGKNRVALFAESTRSFGRRRIDWRGQLRPLAEPVDVHGIGLGGAGLAFRGDRPFEVESLVEVSLNGPDGSAVVLAGRIAWTREIGDGTWESAVRVVEQSVTDRQRLAQWVVTAPDEHEEKPPSAR